jgi:Tfp pilus assembly protein FimV
MPPVSARHDFKPAQQRALALLRDGQESELTRVAYQALCGVSRSQAAYDLAELVEAGVLDRVGGGRSTRYVLVRQLSPKRRHWTSERIRAELTRFCAERSAWPSAREFKASGHADLYVAASRYGGVPYWAAELGLPRASRWEPPALRRFRFSLSWAMIGVVGGALVVGAAVVIVQGLPRRAAPVSQHAARSATAAKSAPAKNSRLRARKPAARVVSHQPKAARRTRTYRTQAAPRASSSSGTVVLAVRTVSRSSQPVSTSSATSSPTESRTGTSSSSTASSGPSPMMAPRQTGSGTPTPLPPPRP